MATRGCGALSQALALLLLSAALGTAAQFFSPRRIPWRENWSDRVQTKALQAGLALAGVDDVRRLLNEPDVLVFDARSLREYESGRIPGALPFPDIQREQYYADYADLLTPDHRALVYCSGRTCDESLRLSLFLVERGHTNVILFVGGFAEWTAAGLPLER